MSSPKAQAEVITETTPLESVKGIGPERAAQLARLKRFTVGDLLRHRPRRHEDRTRFSAIADLNPEATATVRARVLALGIKGYQQGRKSVFELILDDGSGRLHCRWWNLPYMQYYFKVGDEVLVFGRLKSVRPRTFDHPETEVIESGDDNSIHLNRLVPVYPLTEGLPQRWLRTLLWRLLFESQLVLADSALPVPSSDLPDRAAALRALHFPPSLAEAELARQRLALDELLELQVAIQARRKRLQTHATALPCGGDNRWIRPWLASLGFGLTPAQTRVLREIRADLSGRQPMRRLLQGDVGSGKTVVAAAAALMALESGFNVALMAPTEILAEQHWQTFRRWLHPLGLSVALRTGAHRRAAAPSSVNPVRAVPETGALLAAAAVARLEIGTHALIADSWNLERLGLVIIDEQHKFGVAQREQLVRKGNYPHLLVMTATPIPRTLGLTLYGDLDISVLDQLPPGRGGVKTFVRGPERLPKVWEFLRQKLSEGRQAYVVYPLVEESENCDLKAVTQEWQHLQTTLSPYRVGLLHGRLKTTDKDQIMTAFREQRLEVLLTTTVIEVGVDVPNASVMLIENAEQFGLAQLHQLRGRIGRSASEAWCILVARSKAAEARQRLQALAATTDGFRIAEADLQLRGPGELLGHQQSGLPDFHFADLTRDLALVERARSLAADRTRQRENPSTSCP